VTGAPQLGEWLLDVTDTVDSLREALRGCVLLAHRVMQPGAQVEAPQGLAFGALTVARSAADSPQRPAS